MMASQKVIFASFSFCLVITTAVALTVDIPQLSYEFARGDNITLPCNFKPKNTVNNLIIVYWQYQSTTPGDPELPILTDFSTGELDIDPAYIGRASLEKDLTKGIANLKLSSIGLQDNQVYECRITIPNDEKGKVADTTKLVVLVAPSVPVCSVVGTAEFGQNINLTCQSQEGSPPPTYKWQSYDVKNTSRPFLSKTTENAGVLSLFNLTSEFSGFYICTSSNKIRSATCNMTLAVMPPSMSMASTAGFIGAGVAALLALIIIIYCCCCRKKKGEEEEEYGLPDQGAELLDKGAIENGEERRTHSQPDDDDDRPTKIVGQEKYQERTVKELDHGQKSDDRRSDYDDRRSDYDDRRSDYDDRRSDYDDRRSDYDDRRRDHDDRDYDDRRERNDDPRDGYDRYSDRGYDDRSDRGRYSDRYDQAHDDRERPPSVPANKPAKNLKPTAAMDYI